MPRPRRDGSKPRPTLRRRLTQLYVQKVKPAERGFMVWDTEQRKLALSVLPSGHKSFKVVFSFHNRLRWYHIDLDVGLARARELAADVMYQRAKGRDLQAEKRAQRSAGSFQDLVEQYLEHAKKVNKSWRQADYLVRKHLLPRWAKLPAADITKSDVKALVTKIEAPITANQTLAACSAVFSWGLREDVGGLKVNPCVGVQRNKTTARGLEGARRSGLVRNSAAGDLVVRR